MKNNIYNLNDLSSNIHPYIHRKRNENNFIIACNAANYSNLFISTYSLSLNTTHLVLFGNLVTILRCAFEQRHTMINCTIRTISAAQW